MKPVLLTAPDGYVCIDEQCLSDLLYSTEIIANITGKYILPNTQVDTVDNEKIAYAIKTILEVSEKVKSST